MESGYTADAASLPVSASSFGEATSDLETTFSTVLASGPRAFSELMEVYRTPLSELIPETDDQRSSCDWYASYGPCGGCYACVMAQMYYYDGLVKRHKRRLEALGYKVLPCIDTEYLAGLGPTPAQEIWRVMKA